MQPQEATEFTDDQVKEAAQMLSEGKAFRTEVNGYGGTKMMVIAPFYDTQEVMVAVEGGGCAFLKNDTRHNRFIFVQYGFQLPHGEAAERLLNGIADLATRAAQAQAAAPEPAQITDQSKPAE